VTCDDIDDDVTLCVMVLMTLADGLVVESEVTRMRWIHGKVLGRPVSEDEVRGVIARVRAHGLDIEGYLESIRDELGREGRRKLLASAFAIATADGRVLAEEDAMMLRIAQALEIPPPEYRAVLGQLRIARELDD
jgi:uncharacterized tellurite resistance protein B-like protein